MIASVARFHNNLPNCAQLGSSEGLRQCARAEGRRFKRRPRRRPLRFSAMCRSLPVCVALLCVLFLSLPLASAQIGECTVVRGAEAERTAHVTSRADQATQGTRDTHKAQHTPQHEGGRHTTTKHATQHSTGRQRRSVRQTPATGAPERPRPRRQGQGQHPVSVTATRWRPPRLSR